MRRLHKRLTAFLLTAAMILAFPAVWGAPVFAAEGDGTLTMTIDEEGALTWDSVDGAGEYVLTVDDGEMYLHTSTYPVYDLPNAIDIDRWITNWVAAEGFEPQDAYNIELVAYDFEGNALTSEAITYTYTPEAVTLPSVPGAALDEASGELTWNDEAIEETWSIQLQLDNKSCNPRDHEMGIGIGAFDLQGYVDQCTEEDLDFNAEGNDPHQVRLQILDGQDIPVYQWDGTYDYDSSASPAWEPVIFQESGAVEWADVPGAASYEVTVSWDGQEETILPHDADANSCSFIDYLDEQYEAGTLPDDTEVVISIYAYDEDGQLLNNCANYYYYLAPVTAGEIEDVTTDGGVLSWTAYPDAYYYCVIINDMYHYIPTDPDGTLPTSYDLNKQIDRLIMNNEIEKSNAGYTIKLTAFDQQDRIIGRWESANPHYYNSAAEPVEVAAMDADYDPQTRILTWGMWESAAYPAATYRVKVRYEDEEGNSDTYTETVDGLSMNILSSLAGIRDNHGLQGGEDLLLSVEALYCLYPDDDPADEGIVVARAEIPITYEPIVEGDIDNVVIADGRISWEPYQNAEHYALLIEAPETDDFMIRDVYTDTDSGTAPSLDLNAIIDGAVMSGELPKENAYNIHLNAYSEGVIIARWHCSEPYPYTSDAEPVEIGEITGITLTGGQLTWDPYTYGDYDVHYEYGFAALCEGDEDPFYTEYTGEQTAGDLDTLIQTSRALYGATLDPDKDITVIVRAYIDVPESASILCATGSIMIPNTYPDISDLSGVIEDGSLTWSQAEGAAQYVVSVDGFETSDSTLDAAVTSFDLDAFIDAGIVSGGIDKKVAFPYFVQLLAYDAQGMIIGGWEDTYYYESEAEYVEPTYELLADISYNPLTGILSWEPYVSETGSTEEYQVLLDSGDYSTMLDTVQTTSYDLGAILEDLYQSGEISDGDEIHVAVFGTGDEGNIRARSDDYYFNYYASEAEKTNIAEAVDVMDPHSDPSLRRDVEERIHLYSGSSFDFNGGSLLGVYLKEDPDVQLREGTDYTVSYTGNTGSGTMTLTITGIGDYTGTIIKHVKIAPVTAATIADVPFSKTENPPLEITVKALVDGEETTLVGEDFSYDYEDGELTIGEHTAVIFGKGDYTGTIGGIPYRMVGDLANTTITIPTQVYTGAALKPVPTVTLNDAYDWMEPLQAGKDFTVTYKNNTNAGEATVTINPAAGSCYVGSNTASFTIIYKGWVKRDGSWYFYDENGDMVTSAWKKDSKGWCYLAEDGKMVTNDWAKDTKGWCWIASDGYMPVATKWIKYNGGWYYIEKGYRVENSWRKDSKGWCYLGSDGRMVTNDWVKDSKGYCWIASDGYMPVATKWISYEGGWYHITNGYRDQSKWMKDSKGWCWLQADGRMLTNGWAKDSKGWCWIASNGYMPTTTQWVQYEGGWYHITKGYRDQSKWMKDSKGWCWLQADGRMLTNGWAKDSKGTCWIGPDGYMVVETRPVEYEGNTYGIKDGYMVVGGSIEYNGMIYHFNENGILYTIGY